MGHVTQDTSWCALDIDTTAGRVVVLERWQYVWLVKSSSTDRWTLAEKQQFHARAEREIWNAWSNRAFLRVEGSSEFAKRFSGKDIPVYMDIRWVLAKAHWTVKVTKIDEGDWRESKVLWSAREVRLDSNDFARRETCFGPPKYACVHQIPVAHEFGHTTGNIGRVHGNPSDEYADGRKNGSRMRSPYIDDVHSIMHRGNQVRDRHFNHLLTELYELIPDTVFSLGRLQ